MIMFTLGTLTLKHSAMARSVGLRRMPNMSNSRP